ncbi:hypothetical protein QWY93_19110 [Echinicola jeungdonensis]|uniref:hypothetical protein n=1 Tax=Echinicola jeungdonensis TaxID=709343 RepID=UPI0025B5DA0B|nr:hypothetical protein [Echinicola jeungdonensis]MDN3671371.1 hypothetical protein [Echinicola jeungdonensis]
MGKYGVKPLSKMKGQIFVHDLGFDAVYVGGLIYDWKMRYMSGWMMTKPKIYVIPRS